jgi:hypothetical protein
MLKEAIQFLTELGKPTTFRSEVPELKELEFLSDNGEILEPPRASSKNAPKFNTLVGISDFALNLKDVIKDRMYLHIESINDIQLISELNPKYRYRETFATAQFSNKNFGFQFGSKHDQESFILNLQSNFKADDNLKKLISIVSKVSSVNGVDFDDDGVKQNLTVRAGVSFDKDLEIRNPLTLSPLKTFPEIEPAEEKYVFRVTKEKEGALGFFLFKADSGHADVVLQSRVNAWLKEAVKDCAEIIVVG